MWLLAGNGGLDLAGKIEYFAGVVGFYWALELCRD